MMTEIAKFERYLEEKLGFAVVDIDITPMNEINFQDIEVVFRELNELIAAKVVEDKEIFD